MRRAIEAIILDAGGVLIHPNLDWIGARAGELGLALGRDALYRAYYRTMHEADLHRPDPGGPQRIQSAGGGGRQGRPTDEGPAFSTVEIRRWFFGRLLAHAGAPGAAAAAAQAMAEASLACFPRESDIYHWAMPGVRGELEALRAAGFRLAVASNNDGALEAQLTGVGLLDLFEAIKDSGLEGVAKPEPELLWRAARALGVLPERCVFVGDLDRIDGAAARAAGMAFVLLDPLAQERPGRPRCLPSLGALLEEFAAR